MTVSSNETDWKTFKQCIKLVLLTQDNWVQMLSMRSYLRMSSTLFKREYKWSEKIIYNIVNCIVLIITCVILKLRYRFPLGIVNVSALGFLDYGRQKNIWQSMFHKKNTQLNNSSWLTSHVRNSSSCQTFNLAHMQHSRYSFWIMCLNYHCEQTCDNNFIGCRVHDFFCQ